MGINHFVYKYNYLCEYNYSIFISKHLLLLIFIN